MENKLQAISQKVKRVVLYYPMVLAMSLTMAFTIVLQIEHEWQINKQFLPMKIIITSGLGISLLFAIKMLSQRVGREFLWQLLGIVLLVGFYLILPERGADFNEVYIFVLIPTFVLSHLLVACVAFLRKEPEIKFWQYNKNLFVNFFLTLVFTGVLTGGVMLAIVAVEELFAFDFRETIYAQTYFILSIVGSTFIFLLFSERGLDYLELDGNYPIVLKFFTQFILIPLLLIYVVILYLYAAKILFTWQLPQGWVSYLILAYSILGILALLLVHPLKDASAKSWVKIFSRIFYFTLLPLIVLLFTAIFTRVLEYGFTEARYFVLLLAVWLLCVVLYFILIKNATIKFIPVSLFLLGMSALVLPYVNAFSVAKRSQKNALENIFQTHALLQNGKIDFDKKVSGAVVSSISDKFEFLSERHEGEYLKQFLAVVYQKNFVDGQNFYIDGLFTNKTSDTKNRSELRLTNSEKFNLIGDYQYAIQEDELLYGKVTFNNDEFSLKKVTYTDPVFELTLNASEKVDFMPLITQLFDRHRNRLGDVTTDTLFVESDLGSYHVKVIFGNMSRSGIRDENDYYFDNALFLIRKDGAPTKK